MHHLQCFWLWWRWKQCSLSHLPHIQ